MVDGTVITVFDTAQFAVIARPLMLAMVPTLHPLADARQNVYPICGYNVQSGFVGKDPGRTNFHRVTGELTFQRPLSGRPEVHVVAL